MADRLLRIPEVAERLGLDRSHTYALIRSGRFPVPIIRDLGDMRVSERALDQWMSDGGRAPALAPAVSSGVRPRRRRVAAAPVDEDDLVWPKAQW